MTNQKLDSPLGYALAACLAAVIGYLLATHMALGIVLISVILGACLLSICAARPGIALYAVIAFTFNISLFLRWSGLDLPAGLFYDAFLVAGCLGVLFGERNKGESDRYFFHSPVVVCSLVMSCYILLEVANPSVHDMTTWFNAFRKSLEQVALMFLAFNVLTSLKKINDFISVLAGLCLMASLYAVFQQWCGLRDFERSWISNSNMMGLLFIHGEFRKFSTFSGPATFGIDMSCCALLLALIALYRPPFRRWILFLAAFCGLWGMIYSGTRTANVIVVAGLALFILLGFDKKPVRIFTLFAGLVFLFALYVPVYSSQSLNRFRSSFVGSKDESFNVREMDRASSQQYIYTHPIGWGLGSTNGMPGKYIYGTPLDGLQTDDQYLRIALETGWLGLILFCSLNFIVLRTGIRGYFRCRDPARKVLYAAVLASVFAFFVAELAQEVAGQMECDVVLSSLIGLLLRLVRMDEQQS